MTPEVQALLVEAGGILEAAQQKPLLARQDDMHAFLRCLANLPSDLERNPALTTGAETFKYPINTARQHIAQIQIQRDLEPIWEPFDAWAAQFWVGAANLGYPERTPEALEVLGPLRVLAEQLVACSNPLVRELGQRQAIEALKSLKVPDPEGLVRSAMEAATAPAAEVEAAPNPDQLRLEAKTILDHPDPLVRIREEIGKVYGGDTTAPMLAYVSMTSRVLTLREGGLFLHLDLIGEPSSGKTWAYKSAKRLMPPCAVLEYHSGTPRALIYDARSFRHKAIIFAEMGAMPNDEECRAVATALRKLAEENELRWAEVVRDAATGAHVTHERRREGPTVLITTGIDHLEPQMDSRFFVLDLPEEVEQNAKAIQMLGRLEKEGALPPPDPALIAYQGLLQTMAPVQVVIPFVEALTGCLAELSATDPRIRRDTLKLFTLVKVVALLRHAHRTRTAEGAIEALLADYEAVRDLVGAQYAIDGGPSERVRAIVDAVSRLYQAMPNPSFSFPMMSGTSDVQSGVTVTAVAAELKISEQAAWRHVKKALAGRYLINLEWRRRRSAALRPGPVALPDCVNLPTAEDLVLHGYTDPLSPDISATSRYNLGSAPSGGGLSLDVVEDMGKNGSVQQRNTESRGSTPPQRTPLIGRRRQPTMTVASGADSWLPVVDGAPETLQVTSRPDPLSPPNDNNDHRRARYPINRPSDQGAR